MAVSSYRVQNDYTPFTSLKPYELPVNEIFKSLVANTQYWQQGAMRVKSAYDNALGLDLSLEENKERSKEYFKKVDEQMKKLSGSDLANIDVQNQALKLFNPLLEDKYILQDHQNTSIYKKALSDYQSDPAKNQANLAYATDWYNDWVNDPNANTKSKDYVSKAKSYIKYYDYTKEYEDIIKNCHSDKQSETGTKDGYIYINEAKYLKSSKLKGCLESSLSPQAFQQINIEGYGKYGKRYDVLANDYLQSGEDINYASNIAALSGKIQAEKLNAKKSGVDNSELINSLTEQKKRYEDSLRDYQDIATKIKSGDFSFIKNNYENLSGWLYSNKLKDRFSNSFSYSEETNKLSADATYIAKINAQQKALDRQSDENMFGIDMQYKYDKLRQDGEISLLNASAKASGKGKKINPATGQLEDVEDKLYLEEVKQGDKQENSYSLFKEEQTKYKTQLDKAYGDLINYLNTEYPSDGGERTQSTINQGVADIKSADYVTNFINFYNKKGDAALNSLLSNVKNLYTAYNNSIETEKSILGKSKLKGDFKSIQHEGVISDGYYQDEGWVENKYILKDEKGKEINDDETDKLFSPVYNRQKGYLSYEDRSEDNVKELKRKALTIAGLNDKWADNIQLVKYNGITGDAVIKFIDDDNHKFSKEEILKTLGVRAGKFDENKNTFEIKSFEEPKSYEDIYSYNEIENLKVSLDNFTFKPGIKEYIQYSSKNGEFRFRPISGDKNSLILEKEVDGIWKRYDNVLFKNVKDIYLKANN